MSRTRASSLSLGRARPAVEITVRWGSSVLHVTRRTAPRSFVLGESGDYPLPEEKLGALQHELVRFERGEPVVIVPRAAAANAGARRALAVNEAIEIALGDLTLNVRRVAPTRPVPRGLLRGLDRRLVGCWIGAALGALVLVGTCGMPRLVGRIQGMDQLEGFGIEAGPVGRVPVRLVLR